MSNHLNHRFEPIDALRGIAALFVVWQHTSETFVKHIGVAEQGTFLADLTRDFDFGRIGIICFFLISGFVIPSSLKINDTSGIKNFAIRRFFRLYPAYWVSILMVIMVDYYLNNPLNAVTIVANTTMLQGLFQQPHMIGLYWTLQVELIFYFICALLFYFNKLRNDKLIFILILIFFGIFVLLQTMSFITGTPVSLHKEIQLLPYLLSIMFLGSFYRQIYDNKSKSIHNKMLNRFTLISTLLCLGLPVFLLITNLIGLEFVNDSFRFGTGHSLGFVLFFVGLLMFKKVPKTLLWLGAISYSLYLFHPLVMKLMFHYIYNAKILIGYHLSFYMIVSTILSILLAFIIYALIEKPAIKKGHSLTKRIQN